MGALRRLGFAHFELQAAIWFFVASLGYVIYDIQFGFIALYCKTAKCTAWNNADSTESISLILTNVWAAAYLLDSFLYAASLIFHSPDDRGKIKYWSAEVGNVVASIFYMASQALYYHKAFSVELLDPFFKISVLQAVLYALSLGIWSFNSLQYFALYWEWRKLHPNEAGPMLRDIWFYAELTNIVASVGYFYTSFWALLVMYPAYYQSLGVTQAASYEAFLAFYDHNQTVQLIVNFFWDIIFCACAALYGIMWYQAGKDDAKIKKNDQGYFELPDKV